MRVNVFAFFTKITLHISEHSPTPEPTPKDRTNILFQAREETFEQRKHLVVEFHCGIS